MGQNRKMQMAGMVLAVTSVIAATMTAAHATGSSRPRSATSAHDSTAKSTVDLRRDDEDEERAAAATRGPVYQIIDSDQDPYAGIYVRNGTDMANVTRDAAHFVTYGTSAELLCGTWGSAVGPYQNRRWHNIRITNGPRTGLEGWMADRYMSTPNAANQPTPGEAECPTAPPPAPSGEAPMVWMGSPVNGLWDGGEPADGPATHHFLSGNNEHDWALDVSTGAGQDVNVYLAPKDPSVPVTAKVDRIGVACGNAARGGYFVTVGIYTPGRRVGSVTYGHIQPTVSVGQEVNRWGGKVGYVLGGLPVDRTCWTGPHTHIELWSTRHYACYAARYHNQSLNRGNWLGYTGGNVASGIRQPCPSGI